MKIQEYKNKVAESGCIICQTPAVLHHPKFSEYASVGKKMNDWLVIPLCPYHHNQGNYGQSIHSGKATFEKNFGSEPDLLARTIEKMMGGQ